MTSDAPLRHEALIYESQDEYVTRSVSFLREGLAAGEGAIVANSRDGLSAMREALGSDADRVVFFDNASAYTRPARTVAAYCGAFVEQLRTAPSVRAVAQMHLSPAPAEWGEWMAYEAVTNVAYAHLPVWVVCTYDANGLPDPVLNGVWRTHSEVATDGCHDGHRFEDARAAMRELIPAPASLTGLRSLPAVGDLDGFRAGLAIELSAANVPGSRALDMLVAGTEIAANALRHGGGIKDVRVGRVDGRFVCEVVDDGPGFDDPAAGYLAPREGIGTGLWVARQLAWRVEFFGSPQGFTARIWL
jgi:anti-sigma regulatory factor (Ser/Thr protein kinase)